MTGPIIPSDQWPEGAWALLWDQWGQCRSLNLLNGVWFLTFPKGIPMPAGHDWRVPVMRQQTIALEQFRPAVELMEWQERGHDNPDFPQGCATKHAEALRLLALIDGQGVDERPQKGRCPNNAAPGGCQLPNRFCTFPSCDKADQLQPSKGEEE